MMNRNKFQHRQTMPFFGLAAGALLVGTVSLAQAQTQWNPAVATGNWSIATNWVGDAVPGSTDDSLINNGGTAVIDSTSTGDIGGLHIYLGDGNGSGTINMSAGTFAGSQIQVGYSTAGSGFFTQSGGLNCPYAKYGSVGGFLYNQLELGVQNGSFGAYTMSGGSAVPNLVTVGYGGTGTFTQSGGTIGEFVSSTEDHPIGLLVGGGLGTYSKSTGVGTYNLSGSGLLIAGEESIGYRLSGTFNQNGGTNAFFGGGDHNGSFGSDYNSVKGDLFLGFYGSTSAGKAVGTYNLSGGLLTGAGAAYGGPNGEEFIVALQNWTTTLGWISVRIGPGLGGSHGETATDRSGCEGEGGPGGGTWRPYDQRAGVGLRRPYNASRAVEKAVAGGRGGTVFGWSPP